MKQVYPSSIHSGMSQSESYILMLHEPDSQRQIPIFIGRHEAQGILLAQNRVETRRPLTHQVLGQILDLYGLSLTRVTIDRVLDGIFFATLHLTDGFNPKTVDCRPSDAVTLALLTDAPIFVDDNVLEETAVKIDNHGAESSPGTRLEQLQAELARCEQTEDYERAAEIQKQIDRLNNDKL